MAKRRQLFRRWDAKTDDEFRAKMKSRCLVDPATGCWLYQGFISRNGYGEFNLHGKGMRAHRAAYILWKGSLADDLDVCHTCDVRHCCNPDHLWAGTNEQNLHDASDKGRHHCQRKTHCPQGHPYDEANTRIVRTRSYTGVGRACRTCERERHRRRRVEKRTKRISSGSQRDGDVRRNG